MGPQLRGFLLFWGVWHTVFVLIGPPYWPVSSEAGIESVLFIAAISPCDKVLHTGTNRIFSLQGRKINLPPSVYSSKLGHNAEEEGEIICLLESILNFNSSWDSMTPLNRRIQVFVREGSSAYTYTWAHTHAWLCSRAHYCYGLISISYSFSFGHGYLLMRVPGFVFLISYPTFSLMIFISFTSFLCYLL